MKYLPLREYLSALPISKTDVTLRFSEIERIIGAMLPKSASDYHAWWSNQDHGIQAPAWIGAGFVVDSVDLSRGIVRFRRGTKATRGRRATIPKPVITRVKLPANELITAGFQYCGHWEMRGEGGIRFVGDIPNEPGVYAYAMDGVVMYIGVATMSLKKRVYFYGKPGKSQLTNVRINDLIAKELDKGRNVELLVAMPGDTQWNGLPVDLSSGLENGLIRRYMPLWNKKGVAG